MPKTSRERAGMVDVPASLEQSEGDSRHSALDRAVAGVARQRDAWLAVSIDERIRLLKDCRERFWAVSRRWAEESAKAKGLAVGDPAAGEEYALIAGTLKLLRFLTRSLEETRDRGAPAIPGEIRKRGDGQVIVEVGPADLSEKMSSPGTTAEVWMLPGMSEEDVLSTQAQAYRKPPAKGETVLVLGAGNASLLVPGDVLHALFVRNQVVVLKMNPINDYLGPLLDEAFEPLVAPGFLAIVGGDVEESQYLTNHPHIDALHLTGSDRTYEAIVFGGGKRGAERKARAERLNTRPFSAELGNISPVLVVPGPWQSADFAYQGLHVASMLGVNAGFNCLTARLLVQHSQWDGRSQLLDQVRKFFTEIPTRPAYYPGAAQRHARFVEAHPNAELLGDPPAGHLPWTLISGLRADSSERICFESESFCPILAEASIDAASPAAYVDTAVDFVNEQVWGNLVATLLVHPESLKDPEVAASVDRAIANLRYGTVCVNTWGAMTYPMPTTAWGAFPGNTPANIQSGVGFVNNTLMLDGIQKSVVRAPFRIHGGPMAAINRKHSWPMMQVMADNEYEPSSVKVAKLVYHLLRG